MVLVTASTGTTLSRAAPLPASPLPVALLYPHITPTPCPGGNHRGSQQPQTPSPRRRTRH